MRAPTGRSASGGGACQARKGTTAQRPAWRGPPGCGRWPARGTSRWTGIRCPERPGYLVYRAAGEPYQPLDHGGGDVLAVPAGPYADTSGEPGRVRHYAVAAVRTGRPPGRCPSRSRRRRGGQRRPGGGDDRGRRSGGRRAAAAVGTHDRVGAPELHAEPGPDRRPGDRPGGARGAADRPRRVRRAGRPCARHLVRRPRGVHRIGRPAGARLQRRRPGVRPAHGDRPAAGGRAVLHARATWPATRARRCSATARSSRRPGTGTAGPTWSGTWPRT